MLSYTGSYDDEHVAKNVLHRLPHMEKEAITQNAVICVSQTSFPSAFHTYHY